MTQKELAEGICSIKQLRRIEKNESVPNSYLLYEFTLKLGEDLLDYFPYASDPNVYQVKKELDIIYYFYRKKKYKDVLYKIEHSYLLKNSENLTVKQEIKWLLGAVSNHIPVLYEVDVEYYLEILKERYTFNDFSDLFMYHLKPLDLKIINAIIVKYLVNNQYDVAENLLIHALNQCETIKTPEYCENYVRFLYNLARLYLKQEKYEASIQLSSEGILRCKDNNCLSYLADLYNIHGQALYEIGKKEEGKEDLKRYIRLRSIFDSGFDYQRIAENIKKKYNMTQDFETHYSKQSV